jgi:hypothetical protein
MYSRNNESGSLGGEHGPSGMTKTPKAPPTLLPPSTLRSGTSHRPMPVPISFPVRCGPKATYKWLAMVAAQRYAAETSLVGQGRQREASGSAPQGTMLLPSYVSSSEDNDSFHAPDDLIFQGPSALQNGSGVWVTLDDVVPIDGDTSAPSATRWSQLAYMNQRKGKQESAASQEQALGVEREERHRILAQEAQDEKIRHKIDAMRRVLGDIVLRSEADAGLKDHYLSLAGDTMSLFDNEEDVELTLSVLEANYTSLLEVFTTHGLSHKGKTRCMTNNEFSKFAMECKALQPEKNWKISDLYHDSLVKEQGINNRSGKSKKATDKLMVNPDRPVVTTSMDMAGFLVSLRNLAFARFLEQTDGNIPADQIKELGRYKIKDVKDAVQVLLNTAVLPLIDKSAMMALVTKALGIDEVLCVYYDHLSKLRSVFEKYAGSDGVVDTMTITEFSAMIRDAGIMGMAEAKKVFVLVQQGDAAVSSSTSAGAEEKESSGGGGGAGVYDDDNLMTFAEFLVRERRGGREGGRQGIWSDFKLLNHLFLFLFARAVRRTIINWHMCVTYPQSTHLTLPLSPYTHEISCTSSPLHTYSLSIHP